MVTAGKVGTPDGAREQGVSGHQKALPAVSHRTEGHRASGVAGSVVHGEAQPGQIQNRAIGQGPHRTRLPQLNPAPEKLTRIGRERAHRVGQQSPIVRVNPGRDVIAIADRCHRENVIKMPMREQYRYRIEAVLAQQFVQRLLSPLSWINHHTRSTGLDSEDETVRLKRTRGETCHKHTSTLRPRLTSGLPLGHLDCAAIATQATGVLVPTNEQRREAAKRKLDRQLARRAQRAKARRRNAVIAGMVTVVLVIGIVALIKLLPSHDRNVNTAAKPAPQPSATKTNPLHPDDKPAAAPVRPQPLPAFVDCQYPATQQPPARPVKPPLAGNITATGAVAATMQTSAGAIGLTLDRALAPCTVNSFVSLAKQGYFNNSTCHRLVTNPTLHVLQCGDPTGLGTGGPGYTIPDEVFPELTYARGYVAMANTGQPNSGGSQFFLIYGQSELPPQYTVFATITPAGLTVLDQIAKAGDDGSLEPSPGGGKPNQPVTISAVEVPAT